MFIKHPQFRQKYHDNVENQNKIKDTYTTKYFFLKYIATFTRPIITGTSTNGPITAVNASPEFIPKTAIATAIASSKLLLAAVNERVTVCA